KAVVKAVSSERKRLAAQQPQLPRGLSAHEGSEGGGAQEKAAGRAMRRVVHPAVSVRPASPEQNCTQDPMAYDPGLPQLQKLRAIMAQVYALFDRRCRTQTTLDKRAALRRHVPRFKALGETLKKLFSPTLEKALTFLDDKLLPSTSNAVEWGNRRYRKMQKCVYWVRTQAQIRARLALDRF